MSDCKSDKLDSSSAARCFLLALSMSPVNQKLYLKNIIGLHAFKTSAKRHNNMIRTFF